MIQGKPIKKREYDWLGKQGKHGMKTSTTPLALGHA